MQARARRGELSPEELTRWAQETFRYGPIVLAQAFTDFEKAYDSLSFIGLSESDVDDLVIDEARRLTA